jgi:hypothetical protein
MSQAAVGRIRRDRGRDRGQGGAVVAAVVVGRAHATPAGAMVGAHEGQGRQSLPGPHERLQIHAHGGALSVVEVAAIVDRRQMTAPVRGTAQLDPGRDRRRARRHIERPKLRRRFARMPALAAGWSPSPSMPRSVAAPVSVAASATSSVAALYSAVMAWVSRVVVSPMLSQAMVPVRTPRAHIVCRVRVRRICASWTVASVHPKVACGPKKLPSPGLIRPDSP